MSDNIYAAPLSDLNEQSEGAIDDRYYVVSTRKMMILFFMTFGFYAFYWYYQNWAQHRRATGDDVWPLPRAIFAIFFTHSLFRNIAAHDVTGTRSGWNAESAASRLVILMVVGRVLDKMAGKGLGSPYTDLLSILLMIPTALVMMNVQQEINARCGDASGNSNNTFSAANIFWCVLGGIAWALVAIGMFVPEA